MKTKLTTDWICIAMSGKTADGRKIKAEHLNQMAQAYDKNLYTAQIWLEHYRFMGSNYGIVEELKTEQEGDKTKLFAKISPSKEMLSLNASGIGLFTSIEINPNFADTGAAYLVGLAITDSPASLGTTQLQFSHRTGVQDVIVSDPLQEPIKLSFDKKESESKEDARKSFFSWLFSREDKGTPPTGAESTTQDEGTQIMTDAQQQAFAQTIVAGVTAAITQAFKQQGEPVTNSEKPEPEMVTVTAEEYKALKEKAESTEKRLSELENQFKQAAAPATVIPNGANGVTPDNEFKLTTAI